MLTANATKIENWSALSEADIRSDTDFVQEAFRRALFRDIESGDLEYWINMLKGGTPRKEVLRAFYDCPERLFRIAERHQL